MVNIFGIRLFQPYRLKSRGFLTWGVAPSYFLYQPYRLNNHHFLAKKKNNEDTTTEEQEIDMLVYKLYDLTDKEIKIIEGR